VGMLATLLMLGTSYLKMNLLEAFVSFTWYHLNSHTAKSDRSLVAPVWASSLLKARRTKWKHEG